ncbi:unnamed protein product, partial [Ectocarpus sp. 12 AP-2014]
MDTERQKSRGYYLIDTPFVAAVEKLKMGGSRSLGLPYIVALSSDPYVIDRLNDQPVPDTINLSRPHATGGRASSTAKSRKIKRTSLQLNPTTRSRNARSLPPALLPPPTPI